jgi:hypothetical protein
MDKVLVTFSLVFVGVLSIGSNLAQSDHQILFQV